MSHYLRCDQCAAQVEHKRERTDPPPSPWIELFEVWQIKGGVKVTLHFCGWPCLADYATARALVDSVTPQEDEP